MVLRTATKDEQRRFATFTQDLPAMADWLRECGVTHLAMESTGAYSCALPMSIRRRPQLTAR
jgi:hypothetical protein